MPKPLERSNEDAKQFDHGIEAAGPQKPEGARQTLKPRETLYAKPQTPSYEVPGIDAMYLEVIFKKLVEQGIADKKGVAILRKLLIERKTPEQIGQDFREQFGNKAWVDPRKIESIVEPLRKTIYEQFGYEFPAYYEMKRGRLEASTGRGAYAAKPVDSRMLSAAEKDLIVKLPKQEIYQTLGDMESKLFRAVWEDHATFDDLVQILKDSNVPEPTSDKAQRIISVILKDVIRLAKQAEHKRLFPDQDKSKFSVFFSQLRKLLK